MRNFAVVVSAFVGIMILAVATLDKPAPMCPLAKQGCDCGRICTRAFDCMKGNHAPETK